MKTRIPCSPSPSLLQKIVATLLLTIGTFTLNAEEPKPTETPSILATVKNGTRWIIQINPTELSPTANAVDRLTSIEVSKMKNTTTRIYTRSSGKSTQHWIKNQYIVFESSSPNNLLVFDMNQAIAGFPLPEELANFRKSDFPEIQGCLPENLIKEELLENRKVLFYEWENKPNIINPMMLPPNQPGKPGATPSKEQLWVDKETRLPLQWKRQQEIRTYKFTSAPSRNDELPKKFKETLDEYLSKLNPVRPPKIP